MKKILLLLCVSILFASFASAFTVDVPAGIIVFNSERQVNITVHNTDPIEKSLYVKFISPAVSNLIDVPSKIQGDSSVRFALTIMPSASLEGQTYESTLIVELGNEKVSKKIDLAFKQSQPTPTPTPKPNPNPDFNAITGGFTAGLVSLADFSTANALNIVLAIIAAILLIAFIARFVRRVQ